MWTTLLLAASFGCYIATVGSHEGHDHGHHHHQPPGANVYKVPAAKEGQHIRDGDNNVYFEPHDHHDHFHDHHHHDHGSHGHFHDHGHGHGHHHHGHDHHDHHHHHHEEPAAFKYSKQANSPSPKPSPAQQQPATQKPPAAATVKPHDHGHKHGAGHAHSHGHSHGHGHSHSHGHSHHHPHSHEKKPSTTPTTTSTVWLYALGSTLAISIAPFLILFLVPIGSNAPEYEPRLRVFLSFASGGLLGDAFLHLIPHSIPHSHGHQDHDHHHGDHHHDHEDHPDHMAHTIVGMWVLAGIVAFLIVEKIIRHMKGGHHHHHGHGHSHETSHKDEHVHKKDDTTQTAKSKENKKNSSDEAEISPVNEDDADYEVVRRRHREQKKREEQLNETKAVSNEKEKCSKSEEKEHSHEATGDIKVGGYLNLAADFAHNFTDGLAIGASYMAGKSIGLVTTFTIFFHEIPHEIGDFALLVQSGCSKPKAMALQLVTAIGAVTGCLVSLALGATDVEGKISWVLPFTAGGFIYIATVSVIPELLQDSKLGQSIKEVFGLLVGIGMMVVIAYVEESQHQH